MVINWRVFFAFFMVAWCSGLTGMDGRGEMREVPLFLDASIPFVHGKKPYLEIQIPPRRVHPVEALEESPDAHEPARCSSVQVKMVLGTVVCTGILLCWYCLLARGW